MDNRYVKIFASGSKAPLKATPGHFATNHAHINYYLDMTTLKTRLSEAQEVAKHLAERFLFDKVVDTIVCLEGTQVIGAYLAEELTRAGVLSTNAHKTIYVITPEYFLLESGKGFFVKKDGAAIGLREELRPLIDNPVMVCQMKDVIDYRAMDYYQRRYRQSQEDGEV